MHVPFNFRVEDLPAIGKFVRDSYTRDRKDFIAFSDHYDGEHLAELDDLLKAIHECIRPATLTDQMKQATTELHLAEDAVLEHSFMLERYVELVAKDVKLNKSALELPALRTECRRRNAESIMDRINRILQHIAPYITELESKGYTIEMQRELSDLVARINTANLSQNHLLNRRRQLTMENLELFKRCWEVINDILKTGKLLYKKNPVKKTEYTQTYLLKKVRAARRNEQGK